LSARSGCLIPRLFERQLDLALFFARLVLALRDRLNGRFNAERLQQPHDLGSHQASAMLQPRAVVCEVPPVRAVRPQAFGGAS
jgi:hypothetical protein